jgi:RNA polymerase sigma factor (sigma-70 family)
VATSTVLHPVPTVEPGPFASLDDNALVAAIADGSDAAFEAFFTRHEAGVLSFCRHMLGSPEDSEDALQHTFLSAYRHFQGEAPPAHPRAWLYAIARNRCVTVLRSRRQAADHPAEPATNGLAEEVEARFELRQLLRDLRRLPDDQRAALLLFELGALSQAEIAEAIGCPPGKVKALVYQARTGLSDRAKARDVRCEDIREQLSTLRGGRLNSRAIKHHLEECQACAAFREDVRRQRRAAAVIIPVIPVADVHAHVLGPLGLEGASHVGVVAQSAAGRVGRLTGYLTRPRAAVFAALGTATAATLALVLSGDPDRAAAPAVPPAQAVAPTIAAGPPAKHASLPAHGRRAERPVRSAGRASPLTEPVRARTPAPAPDTPREQPPPKSEPRAAPPLTAPPQSPPKAPANSPPSARPGPQSSPSPQPVVPPQQPAPPCRPNGNGQGNAWGLCRGSDGLPAPAEEHRQSDVSPGPKG